MVLSRSGYIYSVSNIQFFKPQTDISLVTDISVLKLGFESPFLTRRETVPNLQSDFFKTVSTVL